MPQDISLRRLRNLSGRESLQFLQSSMKYIDKYPNCVGCPIMKYCGTMVSTAKACNSYGNVSTEEIKPTVLNGSIAQ